MNTPKMNQIKTAEEILTTFHKDQEVEKTTTSKQAFDVDGRLLMNEEYDSQGDLIIREQLTYENGLLVKQASEAANSAVETKYTYKNELLATEIEYLSEEEYLETIYSYDINDVLIGTLQKDETGQIFTREVIRGSKLKTTTEFYSEEELYHTDIFHYDEKGNETRQENIKYSPEEELNEAQEVQTIHDSVYDSENRLVLYRVTQFEEVVHELKYEYDGQGNEVRLELSFNDKDYKEIHEHKFNQQNLMIEEKVSFDDELVLTRIFKYNAAGELLKINTTEKLDLGIELKTEINYTYTYH